MKNSENMKQSTPISNPEYYAAKAKEYAAEHRDATKRPEKWPTVVTIPDAETGKQMQVYTSVE